MPNDRWINSEDPYMACHHGGTLHPLYRKCDLCANNSWCDYGVLELARAESDNFIKQQIKLGFEEPQKYCLDEFGHYVLDKEYLQQRLNKKIVENYQDDLKKCKSFSDKLRATFRMFKNAWIESKNNC